MLGQIRVNIPLGFNEVAKALTDVLYDLPGKLIAIDGYPGVGKTTLGRFLAWRFNVSLVETDLFIIERQGRLLHRNDEISRLISHRLAIPRPVIVDGCAILRLLSQLQRVPDFLIYVTAQDAPSISGSFLADLESYDLKYAPRTRANMIIELTEIAGES